MQTRQIAFAERVADTDCDAPSAAETDTILIRQVGPWAIEHEPVSDTYLLVDASGAYCADLYWSESGECWAKFDSYVAFSGPTTIRDIEVLRSLADLLRDVPRPLSQRVKDPR